jgi:hypothetical protein
VSSVLLYSENRTLENNVEMFISKLLHYQGTDADLIDSKLYVPSIVLVKTFHLDMIFSNLTS